MEKIAITGMSCLFPGAEDIEAFRKNLMEGKNSISEITKAQLGRTPEYYFDPTGKNKDKYYSKYGGFVHDFKFNPEGYAIDPEYLKDLDDSYLWSLYVSKEALKDAQISPGSQILKKTGVVLGTLNFPTKKSHQKFMPLYNQALESSLRELLKYPDFQLKDPTPKDEVFANAQITGFPAALIAKALGLQGGHFALDAACASSLYSLKIACDYLLTHKTDLMLAGAISAAEPWFVSVGFSVFQALATEDRNMPFDKKSEGLIAGQGAGMVVLKRYEDAIRDKDPIYGVIRGSAISNDGRGKFALRPSTKGQILCFDRAYHRAKIDPQTMDYIECHATGTPVGDVTELNSIETFFGEKAQEIKIGSVKSNFGHLLSSAGIASFIKVLLAIKHNTIPATIKVREPVISQKGWVGKKQMVTEPTPWHSEENPRRIGVSAFGFGGTNAHVILEEHLPQPKKFQQQTESIQPEPFPSASISIIGMAVHFGGCRNLSEFTNLIFHSKGKTVSLPQDRWKGMEHQRELLEQWGLPEGKVPPGNYVESFEFDYLHYKIPPLEHAPLLPQQLMILKIADEAIKDAGLSEGGNVAVLVAMESDFMIHHFRGRAELGRNLRESLRLDKFFPAEDVIEQLVKQVEDSFHNTGDINQITSYIGNIMATRVSAQWDFTGPAFTVSSEENSTFRALEIAQMLLDKGEVDAVVLGAVDLCAGFEQVIVRSQRHHPNYGQPSLSFEGSHHGWFVGEGAGAVVLKREDSVNTDKERVYASIEAMAIQIGQTGQDIKVVCQKALSNAKVFPKDITYLEAHASGFPDEDEIEMNGLLQAYLPENSETGGFAKKHIAIGSAKSNVGHTFAASGMASMIKTAVCLYHKFIPGIPGWNSPKEKNKWQESAFYFPTDSIPWFKDSFDPPRRAAINALGIDGACCHLVLSECISDSSQQTPEIKMPDPYYFHNTDLCMFPIAGNSIDELQKELQEFTSTVEQNFLLTEAARQQWDRYEQNIDAPLTLVLLAHDHDELISEIAAAQTGCIEAANTVTPWNSPKGSYFTPTPLASKGKIAFVYPGGYNSYVGMGKHPFFIFPDLFDRLEEKTPRLKSVMRSPVVYPRTIERLTDEQRKEFQKTLESDDVAMFETGIYQSIILTVLMRYGLGIEPQAVFGNSMGELSMMFGMEAWRAPEEMSEQLHTVPTFKTRLVGPMDLVRKAWNLPGQAEDASPIWATYSLQASAETVQPIVDKEERVFLIMINTPSNVLIAGDPAACKRVIKKLGCRYFETPMGDIAHNELLEAEYENLTKIHTQTVYPVEGVDFYTAFNYRKTKLDTPTIAKNITEIYTKCLDFPKLVEKVYEDGSLIFIELGPSNNCSSWISECLKGREHLSVSMDNLRMDEQTTITQCLAKLLSHRLPMNLKLLREQMETHQQQHSKLLNLVKVGKFPFAEFLLNEKNIETFSNITSQGQQLSTPASSTAAVSVSSPIEQPIHKHFPSSIQTQASSHPIAQLIKMFASQNTVHSEFLQARHSGLMNWATLFTQNTQEVSFSMEKPVPPSQKSSYLTPKNIIWDTDALMEFAHGKIANVFGQEYAIIDSYRRRVMLPMPPYLLVHRVTKINAKSGVFEPSQISTEYDIPYNSWHSIDGRITTAICIESGQCDLLLISYLGIDFQNKGNRVYRLLDCSFTYVGDFPQEGETLRYDISINSFANHEESLLFFFSYECFSQNQLVMKMSGGCAGFFSDTELADGKGIVDTPKEIEERNQIVKQHFTPFLHCTKTSFDRKDLLQLVHGNPAACFGINYDQQGNNPSLRFPSEQLLMLDRIVSIDLRGAPWGLGEIWAEKTLNPDDWYFPCHFRDDEVLAGSLIAEGAAQLLQFYMLYLGLQTRTQRARFQPMKQVTQAVRCRGQVLPHDPLIQFRLEVIEIQLTPKPSIRANVEVYLRGLAIVDVRDLGMELSEDQESSKAASVPLPLYNEYHVNEFAVGKVHNCFGEAFQIYADRRAPRTPNGKLQFISRVTEHQGAFKDFKNTSSLVSEYDVPAAAWFYEKNSYPVIPYSIIMELALQPNGFLCTSIGSTLIYPDLDFSFRNLDGTGELYKLPDLRGKTVVNKSCLTSTNASGETIIQKFTFELWCESELFYKGTAVFGYFTSQALSNQLGLDKGTHKPPWYVEEKHSLEEAIEIRSKTEKWTAQYVQPTSPNPHLHLAGGMLNFVDHSLIIPVGGKFGKGYVFASKSIDPTDWFYPCHFYEDPVMPGSLGVEAMLETIQLFALQQKLGDSIPNAHFTPAPQTTKWIYRGQIIKSVKAMSLEVHIKEILTTEESIDILADGNLWRDGLRIYELHNLGVRIQKG